MNKFIDKTIKPVLIIGGTVTALAGLNAFFPRFSVENVQNLEWIQDYTIFVQHWGIMVCLMGVMMVVAAFKESWRFPIMLYSALEKAFMVFLAFSNLNYSYSQGFLAPATMDAIIVIYSIIYFWSLRKE